MPTGTMLGVTKPRLYLTCGLPGAGKTTRARQIVASVNAVHLCADEWVVGLGMSLMNFDFRVKLQDCMLAHAGSLLRRGLCTVIEFGSWSRVERDRIRKVAVREKAATELHYLAAPLDELVRRVRARGGPDAEALASDVLLNHSSDFEPPCTQEIAVFDRYVGPGDPWRPA